MKGGDTPKCLLKATESRVAWFEGERPFLTKISFWHEVSPTSQTKNDTDFSFPPWRSRSHAEHTHKLVLFETSKIT